MRKLWSALQTIRRPTPPLPAPEPHAYRAYVPKPGTRTCYDRTAAASKTGSNSQIGCTKNVPSYVVCRVSPTPTTDRQFRTIAEHNSASLCSVSINRRASSELPLRAGVPPPLFFVVENGKKMNVTVCVLKNRNTHATPGQTKNIAIKISHIFPVVTFSLSPFSLFFGPPFSNPLSRGREAAGRFKLFRSVGSAVGQRGNTKRETREGESASGTLAQRTALRCTPRGRKVAGKARRRRNAVSSKTNKITRSWRSFFEWRNHRRVV